RNPTGTQRPRMPRWTWARSLAIGHPSVTLIPTLSVAEPPQAAGHARAPVQPSPGRRGGRLVVVGESPTHSRSPSTRVSPRLTLCPLGRSMSNVVKQVRVTRTDDIDGAEGAETVTFALDGQTWEIDLGKENREKLTRDLAPFVAAARRAGAFGSGD